MLYEDPNPPPSKKTQKAVHHRPQNPINIKPEPQKLNQRSQPQNLNPQTTIKGKNEDEIKRVTMGKRDIVT